MNDMLLSEAYSVWLNATTCKAGTRSTYAQAIRHMIGWGLVNLSDVRSERVAAFLQSLHERGLKPRTARLHFAALTSVLIPLVRRGAFPLEELALIRLSRPRVPFKARHGTVRFLSPGEVDQLAQAARLVAPRLELPILVAAYSGARVGELARMSRSDFERLETEEPFLWVTELEDYGERGEAKTGVRRIPVCSELKRLVLERCGSTWLFPNVERTCGRRPRSPFVASWTLEHELNFVRRAARLPEDVTFTVLRHTRASWWLQAGVSVFKVSKWLGHSVRVCESHYGGLLPYDPDCERRPA